MAWREITSGDIEAHLNAGELAEYRQHAVELQDPLPILIDDVMQLVRGYIGVRYSLESDGIPDELRIAAIDLVIHRLAKRVAKAGEGDTDRRTAADAALRLLQQVSDGKFSLAASSEVAPAVAANVGAWGSQTRFDSPPTAS